jgi:hypothetical protein
MSFCGIATFNPGWRIPRNARRRFKHSIYIRNTYNYYDGETQKACRGLDPGDPSGLGLARCGNVMLVVAIAEPFWN